MGANRRGFLKILGAIPMTVLGRSARDTVSAPPPAQRLLLNRFSIAGFQYYDGPALVKRSRPGKPTIYGNGLPGGKTQRVAQLENRMSDTGELYRGCPLILIDEPDNPHDPFAVAIYHGETKLGYVPRSDNKHISRLLDQDATLECKIIEVNPDECVWNMVRVEVALLHDLKS